MVDHVTSIYDLSSISLAVDRNITQAHTHVQIIIHALEVVSHPLQHIYSKRLAIRARDPLHIGERRAFLRGGFSGCVSLQCCSHELVVTIPFCQVPS